MNGYQDYFKKRRDLSKKQMRSVKKHGRRGLKFPSIWMGLVATILAGGSIWYLTGGEQQTEMLISHLEISLFGQATADETPPAEKTADSKPKTEAKDAAEISTEAQGVKAIPKMWSDEEVTLFKKLESRKKQLDTKEAELGKLEEELQRQKDEVEKKLVNLEEVRTKIATKLEDKVKVDGQKVETLVSVYANMKPAQAAKVIESLNEDLAVEVLTKMKNKSAAEILNLMNPDKAKKLSERFAGFREPAGTAIQ